MTRLTVWHRIRLCWEVLSTASGHDHPAFEKDLPLFRRGYSAGCKDMLADMRQTASGEEKQK